MEDIISPICPLSSSKVVGLVELTCSFNQPPTSEKSQGAKSLLAADADHEDPSISRGSGHLAIHEKQ